MNKIHNLSAILIYRPNQKIKLDALPKITHNFSEKLETFIHSILGNDIRIIVGDTLTPGMIFETSEDALEDIFKDNANLSLVSIGHLSNGKPVGNIVGKFDKYSQKIYICSIPIFISCSEELDVPEFLPFDFDMINAICHEFEDGLSMSIGLGVNSSLITIYENGYDCLFDVAKALGVENLTNLNQTIKMGAMGTDNFIIPFHSLTSFASVYIDSPSTVIEKFTEWLRTLRTMLGAFELLNISPKIIEGLSSWITHPISEKDSKQAECFDGLEGYYQEDFPTLGHDDIDVKTTPVKMITFEEPATGILCISVNYKTKEEKVITPTIYYVFRQESKPIIEKLEASIKGIYGEVETQFVELDDASENILINQLKAKNINLLKSS